jgi:hypothetical protein
MPFHRDKTRNGYERIWDVFRKTWTSTYKMVASHFYSTNLEKLNDGKKHVGDYLVVHHKDFDKNNNNPQNLRLMKWEEHLNLHSTSLKERWQDPKWRAIMQEINIASHNTPEYLEKNSKRMLDYWNSPEGKEQKQKLSINNPLKNPSIVRKVIEKVRLQLIGKKHSKEHNLKISEGLFRAIREGRKESHKITKVCPICMHSFQVPPSGVSSVYCSKKCAVIGQRGERVERIEKTCPICGKTIRLTEWEKDRIYCSWKCYNIGRTIPREIRNCGFCGKPFECAVNSSQKLCSVLCLGRYANEVQRQRREALVPSNNHKIVKIEDIGVQTVYDVSVSGSQLFGLSAGIYIHNTTFSPIQNCTVWATSDSETYQQELTNLLDRIGAEEKILDWAHAIGAYGDLFVKVNGSPGLGVVSVDDGSHPMNIGRVDYEGVLLGFYKCPQGQTSIGSDKGENPEQLIPPWDYVHFRLLGARKRRPRYSDPGYTEMRQIHLITGADTRQITTRYGTSLVTNALPAYKRLRLAEDSLLLARVTRGIIRYIWKLKVSAENAEAVSALVDQYATLITRARAIDTRPNATTPYDDKQSPLTCIEDLFVPIWGDMDLSQVKVGGEADIRWIVDIDSLRQQLAFSLACPLALGGAYVKEATGSLGSEAISKLDIRFARNARTLQRALIVGLTRLCQIHLAYMGMDPDPRLFEIHMTETSTAEEESLRKSLESGMRTFVNFVKSLRAVAGRKLDGEKTWDYFNEKILRLKDFKLRDFYKSPEVVRKEMEAQKAALADKATAASPEEPGKTPILTSVKRKPKEVIQEVMEQKRQRPIENLDLCSYLPTTPKVILERCVTIPEANGIFWIEKRDQDTWNHLTSGMLVRIGEAKEILKENKENSQPLLPFRV